MPVREFEARKEKLTQGTSLMERVLVQPRTVGNVSAKCSFTTTPFYKDGPVEFDTDIRCADLGEEAGYANAMEKYPLVRTLLRTGKRSKRIARDFLRQ
jgi:hypothetical protein